LVQVLELSGKSNLLSLFVTTTTTNFQQDINGWCDIGNIQLTDKGTKSKRGVLESWESVAKLYQG